MALPSSGPISFADFNTELGNTTGSQIDLEAAAIAFNINTRPHGMDEFYGLSIVPVTPTYSIVGTPDIQDEGLSVSFLVTTTNVSDGTILYWKIAPEPGDTQPVSADFVGGTLEGTVTINSNSGSFSITILSDETTEGEEVFVVQLRAVSQSGTFLTQSQSIFISDTSLDPPPPPPTELYYEMVACDGGDSVYFYGISSPSTNVYVTSRDEYFQWNGLPGSSVEGFTPTLTMTSYSSCAAVPGA